MKNWLWIVLVVIFLIIMVGFFSPKFSGTNTSGDEVCSCFGFESSRVSSGGTESFHCSGIIYDCPEHCVGPCPGAG
ncbi:hypothetical protein HOD38_05205 [archaeon]|jgi:hypothetical protein|nr:hypothetical protein [archaeon]MBT4397637.1 hypothetical protein [archaeon]MBT4441667.1 hypothetical protein [archaeon]